MPKMTPPADKAEKETSEKTKKAEEPKTQKGYFLLRGLTEDDKLPKQARVIVDALSSVAPAEKKAVSVETLAEACTKAGLVTKQPPARIVKYYESRLKTSGIMGVTELAA